MRRIYRALKKYQCEISTIRDKVRKMYSSVPERIKGASFKKHYGLNGKSIQDFERNLAIAMWLEQNEVYVTALVKNNIIIKVFATIGSKYSCRPTHNLSTVIGSTNKLGCEEIRHYHNHTVTSNKTAPSPADILSMGGGSRYASRIRYRCFIIYWNQILEYRILEYSEKGEHQLVYCYNNVE